MFSCKNYQFWDHTVHLIEIFEKNSIRTFNRTATANRVSRVPLGRCCFGLETRVIIKISKNPCYQFGLASMWLNLYGHQAVRHKLKKGLKTQKNTFLALFWAHIGQPDDHISWATLMPFISIYPTNPSHQRKFHFNGSNKDHLQF